VFLCAFCGILHRADARLSELEETPQKPMSPVIAKDEEETTGADPVEIANAGRPYPAAKLLALVGGGGFGLPGVECLAGGLDVQPVGERPVRERGDRYQDGAAEV